MIVGVKKARLPHKEILANLLEKYQYELSQFDGRPFSEQGMYGYNYLDNYFNEEERLERFAYLIFSNGSLAGFALINKIPECNKPCDWSVAEFFIGHPFRRKRIATRAMLEIFKHHTGVWHIKYNCKNATGATFWNNLSYAVAKNKVETFPTRDFYNKSKGKVLVFEI